MVEGPSRDDPEVGDHAVRTWWPDAPGELSEVRFAHSPGRLDPRTVSGTWRWGRYVLVHPEGNTDMAEMCAEYRTLLADDSTFESITVEALLDAGALPPSTADRLRDRYLPD